MIPIKNIYYMLCYAWDVLPEKRFAYVGEEESEDILNLFAMVMIRGFRLLRKRGLYRGYVSVSKETRQIRGKIDFQQSLQKMLIEQGKLNCSADELTNNVLPNQILKSTFMLLYRYKDLDQKFKLEISDCLQSLQFVDSISLQKSLYKKVLLPGSNKVYKFLLRISQFIVQNHLINEEDGNAKFSSFEDEKKMSTLFEEFLRSFYRWELRDDGHKVQVRKKQIKWLFKGELESLHYVPVMETDLMFMFKGKHFIIDAKYYQNMLVCGWKGSAEKVRTSHLYQVFAYIKNWEHYQKQLGEMNPAIHGMLIYPVAEGKHTFHEAYSFENHTLTVTSINLNQPHTDIKKDLLNLVGV